MNCKVCSIKHSCPSSTVHKSRQNSKINIQGDTIYYDDQGRYHRKDGPAVMKPGGSKHWYKHGIRHRLDGPASEYRGGAYLEATDCWFIDGTIYTEKEFNKQIQERNKMNTATKTETISRDGAVKKIRASNGKIFTVVFIKKTNGRERTMNCRLGVKKNLKGVGRALNPKEFVGVFDLQKNDYRVIHIPGIKSLSIKGKSYTIVANANAITPTVVTKSVTLEYSVAQGETVQGLKDTVRSYIKKGWKPLGGITLGIKDGDTLGFGYRPSYMQAMIKG